MLFDYTNKHKSKIYVDAVNLFKTGSFNHYFSCMGVIYEQFGIVMVRK